MVGENGVIREEDLNRPVTEEEFYGMLMTVEENLCKGIHEDLIKMFNHLRLGKVRYSGKKVTFDDIPNNYILPKMFVSAVCNKYAKEYNENKNSSELAVNVWASVVSVL